MAKETSESGNLGKRLSMEGSGEFKGGGESEMPGTPNERLPAGLTNESLPGGRVMMDTPGGRVMSIWAWI
jgi:hypothetical protein